MTEEGLVPLSLTSILKRFLIGISQLACISQHGGSPSPVYASTDSLVTCYEVNSLINTCISIVFLFTLSLIICIFHPSDFEITVVSTSCESILK